MQGSQGETLDGGVLLLVFLQNYDHMSISVAVKLINLLKFHKLKYGTQQLNTCQISG